MNRTEINGHSGDERVIIAARWLAETPRVHVAGSLVAEMKARFRLTAQEVIEAIHQAQIRRAKAP